MNEGEVYYYTKTILRKAGVNVFGGEPPGGSDDLHRIELKDPASAAKGSRGSRKFDLLASHMGRLLLIELKDDFNKLGGDIEKLRDTVESAAWTGRLWDNLAERRLMGRVLGPLSRDELISRRHSLLVKCLGCPKTTATSPNGFLLFEVAPTHLAVRGTGVDVNVLADLQRRLSHVDL